MHYSDIIVLSLTLLLLSRWI